MKRIRSKLVKFAGMYYFKEMPEKEFLEKQKQFSQRNDAIHSEKELAEYLAKEMQLKAPVEMAQYKTIFLPEFTENESAFIFKGHHSLADGLALIILTLSLQD